MNCWSLSRDTEYAIRTFTTGKTPCFHFFWNSTYVSALASAWYLIVNVFLVSSAMKMQYSRLMQNE